MNGDKIIAEWENDILNGKGEYILKTGDRKEAVWKQGLMIPIGEEQDKKDYDNSGCNIILIVCCIVGYLVSKGVLGYLFWFIMMLEAIYFCSTGKYLRNIIALKNTGKTINELI